MKISISGDDGTHQVITTTHLKRVIISMRDLIKSGHEISDVKFINPVDKPSTVVLVYDVVGNLIIEYENKKD